MRFSKSLLICITIITAYIMGCEGPKSNVIEHPTAENLPDEQEDHSQVYTLNSDTLGSTHRQSLPLGILQDSLTWLRSAGTSSGSRHSLFGRISDIKIDHKNRIYILDENQQEIKVFNPAGEYLTTIGRRGRGPAEFEYARYMTLYNKQWLLVSSGYKIEIFDITGSQPEHLKSQTFDFSISSLCTIENRLFVNRTQVIHPSSSKESSNYPTIHSFTLPDFEPDLEFGQAYKNERAGITERMSKGVITCNKSSSTITFLFDRMPVLYGYDAASGNLKWESHLAGLQYARVTETIKGDLTYQISYSRSGEYTDRLLKPLSLNNEFMLLQSDRRTNITQTNFDQDTQVLSFALNSKTGKAYYLGSELRRSLALNEHFLVTTGEDYISAELFAFDLSR